MVNDKIDELELIMKGYEPVDCPLKHRFTPGMYIREIFMPKDSYITSLIHKTKHPFFVLEGEVSVYSENDGVQLLKAGDVGITLPNTRRVLYTHENTRWATCHATDIKPKDDSEQSILEAVNLIADEIIEVHENKLIGGVVRNNVIKPMEAYLENK